MTKEQHEEFYKFTSHASDRPRYTMHYNLDAPVRIQVRLRLFFLTANSASDDQRSITDKSEALGKFWDIRDQDDKQTSALSQALLYVPETKPSMLDLAAQAASGGQDVAVALYSRRVLIQSRAKDILPRWCRFLKVSEDVSGLVAEASYLSIPQGKFRLW